MQTFYCTDDLSCIEPSSLLCELHLFSEMPEQLTSIEKIHDEVQLLISLKGIVKVDDKWILYLFENFTLSYKIV